jgi:predicted transcriptional regulator
MKILLSIKPEFVEQIFNGNKIYEYRKCLFTKKDVDSVIIYSTMPVGKIVGEFKISDILQNNPEDLWELTEDYSGISKSFFDSYFKNRDKAYALKIGTLTKYEKPINPFEFDEKFVPPQSFCYVDESMLRFLSKATEIPF